MDLEDHPFHPDQVAAESGESFGERQWLSWCGSAEKLLGHDLDGDDPEFNGDGYSLDEAFDAFRAGVSPTQYVETVRARSRYRPS